MSEIVVAMPENLRQSIFSDIAWERLSALGRVSVIPADLGDSSAHAALAAAEVLLTGWGTSAVDAAVLAHTPKLRAVVHTAGSVRGIVDETAYRRGLVVTSQSAANALPVAEYTVAMILLAGKDVLRARRLYAQTKAVIDRGQQFTDAGLFGRRVGLIESTRISRRVLELLQPYDLDLVVCSQYLSPEAADALGARLVELDELLATSQVISLHAALLPSTRHMIGDRELALIADGATLINTARGGLIDQDALVAHLRTGRFDAILDVADPDVTVPDSPLWDLPNVVLTPHFAGAVGNELYRLGQGAVADVEAVLAGRQPAGNITEQQFRTQA